MSNTLQPNVQALYNEFLQHSAMNGNKESLDYIMEKGAEIESVLGNKDMVSALREKQPEILQRLQDEVVQEPKEISDLIQTARDEVTNEEKDSIRKTSQDLEDR